MVVVVVVQYFYIVVVVVVVVVVVSTSVINIFISRQSLIELQLHQARPSWARASVSFCARGTVRCFSHYHCCPL